MRRSGLRSDRSRRRRLNRTCRCWLRGYGLGRGGFGVSARGLGIAARRCGTRVLLGAGLVIVAPVIGDVEAAALEEQPPASADRPLDLALAPALLRAAILGAHGQGLGRNRLNFFKLMSAFFADVLVSRHSRKSNRRRIASGQETKRRHRSAAVPAAARPNTVCLTLSMPGSGSRLLRLGQPRSGGSTQTHRGARAWRLRLDACASCCSNGGR